MELITVCCLLGVAFAACGAYAYSLHIERHRLNEAIAALAIERGQLARERAALVADQAKRPKSVEAEELLHDLTRGVAIVRISPMNPDELFLRSPRG